DQRSGRQLWVVTALVDVEQRVAEEDCSTAGQSCGAIRQRLPRQRASGQTGCGKQQNGEDERNKTPRQESSQNCSSHLGERGIKNKSRLARSKVRAIGPVRVEDAHRHALPG